jgi:hypothetical protein
MDAARCKFVRATYSETGAQIGIEFGRADGGPFTLVLERENAQSLVDEVMSVLRASEPPG